MENTSNPEYDHVKEIRVSPVTRQLIDYLNSQPLIVEVWGSQTSMKAPGVGGGGEASRMVSNATIEKVEAELRTYKLLKDTAEKKLEVKWSCATCMYVYTNPNVSNVPNCIQYNRFESDGITTNG